MERQERNPRIVGEQLERVLSSSGFARNERLSRFLRFVVERHLDGRDEEIKESLIAVEVFNRRPDYDPKLDSVVRTEAGRLRARLAEYYATGGKTDPTVIEIPKGGYTPVVWPRNPDREHRNANPNRLWVATGLVAVMALTATGAWRVRDRNQPIAIAVLPLQNLSAGQSNEYFADGLTDEIIRNLSVIEGLAVRSRTSSFALKGTPRNVREAGRQLTADYLLEGSVLPVGQRIRVNVQLVRVRDDFPVWSGKFDRASTDVLAIQDEISLGIVNNLRLQLGRGRRMYETSAEAYDVYLRARALSLQDSPTRFQSIERFAEAIDKDPAFALAYAGLASIYALRSVQFPLEHSDSELSKMRTAAEKAIQLDPLLAEAHDALGMVYAREGKWESAETSFRRAIGLDPNRAGTYINYARWFLALLGRTEEALQQLRRAEKADPLSPDVRLALGGLMLDTRRYDAAVEYCDKLPIDHGFRPQCLARARFGQGNIGEAIRLLADDPSLSRNPQTRGWLGYVYARSGRQQEAEKLAAASHYPNEQALIFAGLDDTDRAFEALDRMAVLGAQRVGRYLNYPELVALRGDPRVYRLRQKVGLPE